MTLHLTPEMLVACYEFLRTTPPFDKWKLPDSDEIEFRVVHTKEFMGLWERLAGKHVISMSNARMSHTHTLLDTMAHEMVHIRQEQRKCKDAHGRSFRKMRGAICKHHGFDPKAF
jgi:hypothetical protein